MTDPSKWKTPEDWTDRIVDVVDDDLARVAFEEIIRAAQRAAFDEARSVVGAQHPDLFNTEHDRGYIDALADTEDAIRARRDELLGKPVEGE